MTPAEQLASRLQSALALVQDVFRNPAADPRASLVVFGLTLLLLLVVLVLVMLIVTAPRDARRSAVRAAARPMTEEEKAAHRRARLVRLLLTWSVVIAALAAIWAVTGVTTASRSACASCHSDSPHLASRDIDQHASVPCASCHEPGGLLARVTVNLPGRAVHYIKGASGRSSPGYSRISSQACASCHKDVLKRVTADASRGILVSHAEPVAAGSQCVDCHKLSSGIVSKRTAGMNQCLRCHDGKKAPAACTTCHKGDPARAIVAKRVSHTAYARELVPDPKCDTCHSTAGCNKCHGISMPHTIAFKATGHARAAAEEIWAKGASNISCRKCHYPGRRDCTLCHQQAFPGHGPELRVSHKGADPTGKGCTCHNWNTVVRGRNFCLVCHAPQDIPRPGR